MAVMAQRSGITFDPPLMSDVAPLAAMVQTMIDSGAELRALRDPTRGGLATTLKEFALESDCCMVIDEERVLIPPAVRGSCDLLGLDPLYVANEGILVAVAAATDGEKVLAAMRSSPYGRDASIIGEVAENPGRAVVLKTRAGGIRIIDMLTGEQLPRIC